LGLEEFIPLTSVRNLPFTELTEPGIGVIAFGQLRTPLSALPGRSAKGGYTANSGHT
jgi:hypothetical protein